MTSALDVLAAALGDGPTGRLWRLVYGTAPVARSVSAYQTSQMLGGEFHVVIDLRPDADLAAVERLVNDQLAHVKSGGLGAREIRQVFAAFEVDMTSRYETVRARGEQFSSSITCTAIRTGSAGGWTPSGSKRRPAWRLARRYLGDNRVAAITAPAGARHDRAQSSKLVGAAVAGLLLVSGCRGQDEAPTR